MCTLTTIPMKLFLDLCLFVSEFLEKLSIPISEGDYEYMLNKPIPFRGLEGEEIVMTATEEGPKLKLIDADEFGNEVITERTYFEDGLMEQVTYFKKGGPKVIRKFKRVLNK